MKKPLIVVTAPVQTRSGYGNHSRDICRALIEDETLKWNWLFFLGLKSIKSIKFL